MLWCPRWGGTRCVVVWGDGVVIEFLVDGMSRGGDVISPGRCASTPRFGKSAERNSLLGCVGRSGIFVNEYLSSDAKGVHAEQQIGGERE